MKLPPIWPTYIKKHLNIYLLGFMCILTTATMQVAGPRLLGLAVDQLQGKNHFLTPYLGERPFMQITFIYLTVLAVLALGRFGWRKTLARITHRAGADLRKRIWSFTRFFPQKTLQETFTLGHLMNASTSDVNSARMIFGFTLVALADVLLLGPLTVIMMLSINWSITLATCAALPLLPYFIKKLADQEGDRYRIGQEYLSKLNDLCAQAVACVRLQRLTGSGPYWVGKLVQSARDVQNKRLLAVNTSLNYIPLMGLGAFSSLVILFVMGVPMISQGTLSVGEFITLQGLVLLLQDPFLELGFIISEWKKASISLERLQEIYEGPQNTRLTHKGPELSLSPSLYEVTNLSFSHGKNRPLLSNVNFQLKEGEHTGIMGPTGSGKSTLLEILAGLNDDHQGEVKLCGKTISSYEHSKLRKHLHLVPQKVFLFATSIAQNVAMHRDMSEEEVWHYLEMACLADDIHRFPQKLKTPLGEWGVNLSGGQIQRLGLARGLSLKPNILFIDDGLSAVDTITEEKLLKNISNWEHPHTAIWVAHRQSTLRHCQRILKLEEGVLQ